MKRWKVAVALLGLVLFAGGTLFAQSGSGVYLSEDAGQERMPWAFGIGFGLVELGDNVIVGQRIIDDDDVEQYLTVNLRIPFGHRGVGPRGWRGYLEPEIGYWDGDVETDTLLGINIVGSMPFNAVEFFVGGGIGIHLLDRDFGVQLPGVTVDDSDEALGLNAHFGVDVDVSKKVAVFGVGRFDIVDDERDELEGKAYVGLRFKF